MKLFFSILVVILIFKTSFAKEKVQDLTLEMAQKIAAKAAACGVKNKWKLSIALVNSEGNLIYFQRGDGSYVGSIQAAIDKAKSANDFQRPTKYFADGLNKAESRVGLVTIKGIVGIEGGVPIKVDDHHIGGLGISGARAAEDDQCAEAALQNL